MGLEEPYDGLKPIISKGVQGPAPPENFWKLNAGKCILAFCALRLWHQRDELSYNYTVTIKERQSKISITQPCKQIVEWYFLHLYGGFAEVNDRHCKFMFLLSLSLDRINIISSLYLDSWSNESSQRSLAEKPANFAGYWLLYTTLEKCHCKLQGPIKSRNFGSKLTHLCGFWLDISFFSHVKTHRSQFSLDISFFSRLKTIVYSSDWLELICIW